ncbi:uracil-DNA glycosylase [Neolewinella lacunae]|uniref:Uracil-DNA glycosylase n=1 Tax=Neolewinella lacunae TaxID=1517758 RepID=A0A923TDW2_9BACT|nr:uracil-DNA glycosylase [Neolewinella lacunae]MBC6995262.1 uracil-DNA glycosylase [Neolewinella lacunae]MDN3635569.1 uracil-DNA glycosylase [Neolewinella lacunae]
MPAPAVKINEQWKIALEEEFAKPYFRNLIAFLKQEKSEGKVIYPAGPLIFNAYDSTPLDAVKVVILGQDPYHNPGQAMGLSFSVPRGTSIPPSLRNIYKELHDSLGLSIPAHGDLSDWARQGVFLLNAMLTVERNQPGSHQRSGWQYFTDASIKVINAQREHVVFMLWGAFAQKKAALIDPQRHLILSSAHPSPFSADRGFFGNQHFKLANDYLVKHGQAPIDWQVGA